MTVAWLPLKEHSSRCPGKNWRILDGKPLFCHVIGTLLQVEDVRQIIVNVDSPTASSRVTSWYQGESRISVFLRPPHLREPTTSTVDLVLDDLVRCQQIDDEPWILTHATVPFTPAQTFQDAAQFLSSQSRYDSVISVTALRERLYDSLSRPVNHNVNIQLPLQDLPPLYVENNAFFVLTARTLWEHKNRIGSKPYLWEMSAEQSIDIDHEIDFTVAEALCRRN